jgi:aryl-alcohol dehydrogenase-like predicted oxidoreductase
MDAAVTATVPCCAFSAASFSSLKEFPMQYRRVGRTGLQLSALSFGAWVTFGRQVGRKEARELLALAHDRGVNYFDNAETYHYGVAEQVMGDVLADLRFPRD